MIFHGYVTVYRPGKPPFSYGFPMVFPLKSPFSYGFPMVFQYFFKALRGGLRHRASRRRLFGPLLVACDAGTRVARLKNRGGKPATTPGLIRSSGGLTMWFLDGLI